MTQPGTYTVPTFENLDRGVLFAAIGGVTFSALEASLSGVALTIIAAMMYGLARNPIANVDAFKCTAPPLFFPGQPGLN